MDSLIVTTKNKTELHFIHELLKKMRIQTKVLSAEDIEDFGLIKLMKEADRTKKVSREKIMAKLGRK
ncbi:MAG TPA: hypothetical protein PKN48_03470 [Bacteroidales bacterium]|nr:hypothetical protein [Bacteroidales bacterium]